MSQRYTPPPSSGSSGVSSFNTRTGAVTLSKTDVTGTGLALSDLSGSIIAQNPLAPSAALYETCPRQNVTTSLSLTSGTLYLMSILIPSGVTIGHLVWLITAAGSNLTHSWFTLHNSSRVMLAATADRTTSAFSSNAANSVAIANIASGAATSFTTTYSGQHYLGFMCTQSGGSMPTLGAAASITSAAGSLSPVVYGSSNTAQSTPPSFPFTANALTVDGTAYGYVAA